MVRALIKCAFARRAAQWRIWSNAQIDQMRLTRTNLLLLTSMVVNEIITVRAPVLRRRRSKPAQKE